MDAALADFSHPAAHRELKWDLSRAGWIRGYLQHISDPARRALVERFLMLYESEVVPALPSLRRSVIYGDANDYNVLVSPPWPQPRKVVGVIDFGDMHHGLTVSEVAIAAAYAMLGEKEPLSAASCGYRRLSPRFSAERSRDQHSLRSHCDAPRGQRHEFRAPQIARLQRPLRDDQRGSGMGSARNTQRDSSKVRALHISRCLRFARCATKRKSSTMACVQRKQRGFYS